MVLVKMKEIAEAYLG